MRTPIALLCTLLVATLFVTPAYAADAGAGKTVAQTTCQACHGVKGIGITDQYPNLAGQKAPYLAAQLKAFRDGTRTNPIMGPMAKQLTDIQIENVAAYYSSLPAN